MNEPNQKKSFVDSWGSAPKSAVMESRPHTGEPKKLQCVDICHA